VIIYDAADGTEVIFAEEFTTPDIERAMLATASPEAARSLRRHFAGARAAEAGMNERATDEQKAITFGCCVIRDLHTPDGLLRIWGTVLPFALIARDERERGASPDEIVALLERLTEGYQRGWRYGRWYSVVSPEGDYGAHHVADLRAITVAGFDAAQWAGWRS
jgi:hypothetical protein